MKSHVLTFGLIGGALITALKWTEYRFLVIDHSIEIYSGLIAATFAVLGIWLGRKFTARPEPISGKEVLVASAEPVVLEENKRADPGLTRRELEVLELISENTIKTHSSRVFDKLGAKRRTQAVQLGKEFGLLP